MVCSQDGCENEAVYASRCDSCLRVGSSPSEGVSAQDLDAVMGLAGEGSFQERCANILAHFSERWYGAAPKPKKPEPEPEPEPEENYAPPPEPFRIPELSEVMAAPTSTETLLERIAALEAALHEARGD